MDGIPILDMTEKMLYTTDELLAIGVHRDSFDQALQDDLSQNVVVSSVQIAGYDGRQIFQDSRPATLFMEAGTRQPTQIEPAQLSRRLLTSLFGLN